MMMPSCRFRGSVALCLVAAVALTGCGVPKEAAAEKKDTPAETPAKAPTADLVVLKADAPELHQMKIEPVRTFPLPAEEVTAPARIEVNPNRVGHAILPAPGRIAQVLVKLGDSVTAGQPVVTIHSSVVAEAEAGFVQSEAGVRQAELALAKAEADLARLTDLYEHQAVAQKEMLSAQTTAALSKASVEQAQSAREQARRRLQFLGLKSGQFDQLMTVTAPISGKVLELNVVAGEFRNEINTPLITIADLSRVWATSEVPESQIRFCRVGGAATLELIAYPGEDFRARVTRIADTVNSETRTVKVTAEIENVGGRLRPEMFGRLHYASGTLSTPWVPEAAVVRMGDKDFVFVEEARGRFRSTPVDLGRHFEQGYTVVNGVSAGKRIVTEGSIYLKAAL
jgi:membrane fusion protein, heavy metal efflux system